MGWKSARLYNHELDQRTLENEGQFFRKENNKNYFIKVSAIGVDLAHHSSQTEASGYPTVMQARALPPRLSLIVRST